MIVLWIILGMFFVPALAAVAFCILLAAFLIRGAHSLLHGKPEEPQPTYLPSTWTDTRTRV